MESRRRDFFEKVINREECGRWNGVFGETPNTARGTRARPFSRTISPRRSKLNQASIFRDAPYSGGCQCRRTLHLLIFQSSSPAVRDQSALIKDESREF